MEQSVSKLQSTIYSSNFDISSSFLPENEIVKNIFKSKNPNIKKEELDQMVDGKKPKGVKKLPKAYPLPKTSTYHSEAKKIKNEVREAATGLIKGQKDLIQDLIKMSIKIGTAVPAIAMMVAAPPWNVPAAIQLVLLIVDAITAVIGKMTELLKFLEPLKKLGLVVPESAMKPIQIALTILTSLFSPISALKSFIDILMGQMKNKAKPENLQNQASKSEEERDKKKADLDKAKRERKDTKMLQSELDDLNFRTEQLQKGYDVPASSNGEFSEDDLKNIDPNLFTSLTAIKDLGQSLETFAYDVKLPDGSMLINIDENRLDDIKHTYKVIFQSEDNI